MSDSVPFLCSPGKSESESALSQSQDWDSEENPSPDLLGPSQFSTISSDPSPVSLSITDLLKVREIDNLRQDDLKCLLNQIIYKVTNLEGLNKENINRLAQLLGSHLSAEVKLEADYHRCVRACDDESFSAAEVLDKELKIEALHVLFESLTKKSGRQPGPNREKIACLQASYYESILKGANLFTVGPVSLMKTNEMLNKVQSKHVLKGNIGGSYSYHQKASFTEPLPVTTRGPVVSDNAQKEISDRPIFLLI